jgi:hypothetical protein
VVYPLVALLAQPLSAVSHQLQAQLVCFGDCVF